jgi:catechol 2,3-dioxygenase-like lactoylglutathione lyase family enzyme
VRPLGRRSADGLLGAAALISHVVLPFDDSDRAHAFWSAVLPALGWKPRFADRDVPWAGWQPAHLDGPTGRPLIVYRPPLEGARGSGNGNMLALLAPSRAAVDGAHAAALAAGGSCAGPPGPRPHYHADFYGAYFHDTEGNKVCVCSHDPA